MPGCGFGPFTSELEPTILWVSSNSDCSVNPLKPGQCPRCLGARLLYSLVTPRWVLAQSRQSTGGSTPSKLSPCDHNLIKTLLSTVLILVQNFSLVCMLMFIPWQCPPCLVLHGGFKTEREIKGWGESGLGRSLQGCGSDSLCCHPSCHPALSFLTCIPLLGQPHSLTSLKNINQLLGSPCVFCATGAWQACAGWESIYTPQ